MMNIKRIAMIMFIAILAIGTSAYGAHPEQAVTVSVEISVDGEIHPVSNGQNVYIIEGRTYVPLNYFSDALNVDAGWHPGRRVTYVGSTPDWKTVDQDQIADADTLPIRFYLDGIKKGLSQGQNIFIEDPAPYVPLRFIAEALGKEVTWKQESGKSFIQIKSVD